MNADAHLILIPIMMSSWLVLGAFFTDWSDKHRKIWYIDGPADNRAYVWTLRGISILLLVFFIFFYIRMLTGD